MQCQGDGGSSGTLVGTLELPWVKYPATPGPPAHNNVMQVYAYIPPFRLVQPSKSNFTLFLCSYNTKNCILSTSIQISKR